MNINNEKLKYIFLNLKNILDKIFYQQNNENKEIHFENKLNIFMINIKNSEGRDYLIQIKNKNVKHILGLHYWQMLEKKTKTNDYKYIKTFLNKIINHNDPLSYLERLLTNNWKIISDNIVNSEMNPGKKIKLKDKYSSNDFFTFLISRIEFFVQFIELIYNESENFYFWSNNTNNNIQRTFSLSWENNTNGFIPIMVLRDITSDNYQYNTYIPISIRIKTKNNIKEYTALKIRNVKPMLKTLY
ncbi:hypothetical protein [Mycoplasma sp. CSL7503-lung]|uniref:hypothetical protein n=1 Tax=Mycoplasma sp. CSL7503-lung TaxID=536372 RepID=UPI0021CF6BCC|nr:hypothetical protein [Mycoplasma sp. CSL7503-lung]MCU4707009.1 hypothetical protein [Mycoplasma sp. CSL7503-lung]